MSESRSMELQLWAALAVVVVMAAVTIVRGSMGFDAVAVFAIAAGVIVSQVVHVRRTRRRRLGS